MSEKIHYFGYGANREPRMMSAILGKPQDELVGQNGVLEGYSLAVQRLDQIPDEVKPDAPVPISPRQLLRQGWGDNFTSYVILTDEKGKVAGTIWELSPEERERVRFWELLDFGWYEDCEGQAETADGQKIKVATEKIREGQQVDHIVDGLNYGSWLFDPAKFEAIAATDRGQFDEIHRPPTA